ncbi:MAG TPA: exonuclease SbcCD subunit D [Candidatus Binatia bacterium]|nr:exonuclease SbcCD subunit D [Candidatus Binatia bacterium]
MRFLHTGDWHVGKPLKGRSRLEEHVEVLDEIVGIARAERVDALLVGGDAFEHQVPTAEVEKLVWETLARCCAAGIAVVLIGGNHEHPRKLAALQNLLDPLRIFVRPEPVGPAHGGVISLPSRDGREAAQIAVLPFAAETRIAQASDLFDPAEQWYQAYADRVARMLEILAGSFRADCVNLMLAHLMVSGALVGGGERPTHLLDVYGVTPERLPPGAHYIGLNHLHRPQRLPTAAWCEYSGSPLQLDFGELQQDKRVVLVEGHPGRPVEVRSVPLTSGRRLLEVRGTLETLRARADELRGAWLRVHVEVPAPTPGIAALVKEALPDALEIRQEYPAVSAWSGAAGPGAPEAMASGEVPPAEMLRAYYRQAHQAELPEAVGELFARLYQDALDETV